MEEEEEEDIHFLGEIGSDKNYWSAQIRVNGRTKCFKLDTGAVVTVLRGYRSYIQRLQMLK